jgi:hypothetical protein
VVELARHDGQGVLVEDDQQLVVREAQAVLEERRGGRRH